MWVLCLMEKVVILGLNYIIIVVSDLEFFFEFYRDILGFIVYVKWDKGVYLFVGEFWFCFLFDEFCLKVDYIYVVFDIVFEEFDVFVKCIVLLGVDVWKENKSEG